MVSIIVPVYNTEEKIDRCVSSLIAQTYSEIEIIIVNDGSCDNSLEHCLTWKQKDERVHVFSQTNSGVSAARNRGIIEANGEYVIFVDSDDFVSPNLIELLVAGIGTGIDEVVCCMTDIFSSCQCQNCHLFSEGFVEKANILKDYLVFGDKRGKLLEGPVCKLYRKELLIKHCITFDTSINFAEDWLFNINYYRFAREVKFITNCLYFYDRTSESSLSRGIRPNDFDVAVYVRKVLAKWFPKDCSGIFFKKKVLSLQKHYIRENARKRDLFSFMEYVKYIFYHDELRSVYNELADDVPKQYIIPSICVRHECLRLYFLWTICIGFDNLCKYYLSKFLKR